jgi:hypothetical protein
LRCLDVDLPAPALYGRQQPRMKVYLIDGTYELFRHYYALPSARMSTAWRSRQSEASSPRCWA